MHQRGPDTHNDDRHENSDRRRTRQGFDPALESTVGLHNQPSAAEQSVGKEEPDPREEAEGTQPIEAAAVVGCASDSEAADEGTQGHTLRECRNVRSDGECLVPEWSVIFGCLEAKLKGDATPNET